MFADRACDVLGRLELSLPRGMKVMLICTTLLLLSHVQLYSWIHLPSR